MKYDGEVGSRFDKRDLKGAYDIRTYIAHDYEGVDLAVIETAIKQKLPAFEDIILSILQESDN